MRNTKRNIILGLVIIGLTSCVGKNTNDKTDYVGNFQEKKFEFFESFRHNTDKDYYYKLPFELKFGGIKPYPFDTTGKKEFSWLRNPKNLILAFNTIKSIGFEKFVSKEQYNKNNSDWCCGSQWEKKSLNEIVKEFIHSDTNSVDNNYYSKFWQRRRKEGNLKITYNAFKQINEFYNGERKERIIERVDTVLQKLLDYNLQLNRTDSSSYTKVTLEYFDYLKAVKLDYSAYKLVFHNPNLKFTEMFKDSLLKTIKHDKIKFGTWKEMNDNIDGWITSEYYPDPNRNYGP